MKITFLMPPSLDNRREADRCYGCNYGIYFLPHLPTLYAATILHNNRFKVKIEDFAAKHKTKEAFIKFISQDDSDIYIFFTVFLSEETDIKARKRIRSIRDDAKFIYCGTQATWNPNAFLDGVDSFVVRGEPDFGILDVVNVVKGEKSVEAVKGLSFVKEGVIKHNPLREPVKDIDIVPIPNRSLLDHSPYFNPKLSRTPHTAALTSRGCSYKCWYCVPNSLSFSRELEYKKYNSKKPAPRLHSVERVIDEFREISKLGFKSVSIMDDEFIWNDNRTIAICNGIKDLNLEWSCLARPDFITEKSAKAMAEAGCYYVDLGVESFDQKVLDAIKKDIKVEEIPRGTKILKDYGIEPEINVLLGATPVDTEEKIRKTIDEVEKLDVNYVLYSIASPFPGTDFYYAAKENGWFTTEDNEYKPVDPSKEAIISYPHLTKEKLDELLSYAYRRHYFNLRYIAKQFKQIRSLRDFRNKASTAVNLFRRNVIGRF
jgi:radical SAM superfamily enzyme YgiQ (UPF0313 family)